MGLVEQYAAHRPVFKKTTVLSPKEKHQQALQRRESLGLPPILEETRISGHSYSAHMEDDSILDKHDPILRRDFRPLTATYLGDGESEEVTAKKGLLGTPLGAKRSHLHAVLGEGDNSVTFQGNSQRNIALIESQSGHKDVNLSLGGGDDKVVLYLQDSPSGTIFIDGGSGENELEVYFKTPETYQIANADDKNFISDPEKLTIFTRNVQSILQANPWGA